MAGGEGEESEEVYAKERRRKVASRIAPGAFGGVCQPEGLLPATAWK
jgi:hypothetical protein